MTPHPHPDVIVSAVAEVAKLPADQVRRGKRRTHVSARRAVIRLMRDYRGMSYWEIAETLGGMSHASILAANRKFDDDVFALTHADAALRLLGITQE